MLNRQGQISSANGKANETMTGPVSIYAIAEMSKRAEEYSLKVRSELFRIGCSPQLLKVMRQGSYLQMRYRQQMILVAPNEVLCVLQKTPVGTDEEDVWTRVCEHSRQRERQRNLSRGWSIAVVISLAALLVFLLLFTNL